MNGARSETTGEVDNPPEFLNSLPIGPDFIKFFAGSSSAAAFLAGFSYTNEYFHSFGISIFDLDISYFKMAASAGYLLQDYWILLGSLVVVTLFSFAVAASRYFFGSLGLYSTAALLL